MRATTILTLLGLMALLLLPSVVAAASLETHALVTIVPPVEASLAAPLAGDGDPAWRIEHADAGTWQVHVETRHPDGTVLATGPVMPSTATGGGQELVNPATPEVTTAAAPVVLTLVLCRE
jgi:hypothetical protein